MVYLETFSEYSPNPPFKEENEFPLKGLRKGPRYRQPFPFTEEQYRYQNSQKKNLIKFHTSKKWFKWQTFQATPNEFQLLKPRNWHNPSRTWNVDAIKCTWKMVKRKKGKKLEFFNHLQRSRTWNCEKHTFFCTLFFSQALWNFKTKT